MIGDGALYHVHNVHCDCLLKESERVVNRDCPEGDIIPLTANEISIKLYFAKANRSGLRFKSNRKQFGDMQQIGELDSLLTVKIPDFGGASSAIGSTGNVGWLQFATQA